MPKNLIEYSVSGSGPAVILLHGLNASRCDWVWLSNDLVHAGYRTYMPDLLGHGDSAKPRETSLYTMATLYAVMLDWLDSLPEAGPLYLVGHSLGGHLLMQLALRQPQRVRAQVLLDPFYTRRQVGPLVRFVNQYPHLSERAVRHAPAWLVNSLIGLDPWTTNNFPPDVRKQIASDYKRASSQVMHYPASAPDLTDRLPAIDQPTLVIWGERDLTLAPASFTRLLDGLPNAAGQAVPNCGHQPHVSRPDLVNPWVVDFFNRAASRQPGL